MEPKNEKATKSNLVKKPSLKSKTAPPVRQTLTSYMRMLKADPLLLDKAGVDVDSLISQNPMGTSSKPSSTLDIKSSSSSQDQLSARNLKKTDGKPLIRTQCLKYLKTNNNFCFKKPSEVLPSNSNISENKNAKLVAESSSNSQSNTKTDVSRKPLPPIKIQSKLVAESASSSQSDTKTDVSCKPLPFTKMQRKKIPIEVKATVNLFPKGISKVIKQMPSQSSVQQTKQRTKHSNMPAKTKTLILRKSISSEQLQTNDKCLLSRQAVLKLNQSKSEDQLYLPAATGFKEISPILEDSSGNLGGNRNMVFKTPTAYNRRSICHFTPRSNRKTIFQASTPAPIEMQKLQERLNKWLSSRGKPPALFHNLRVFGSDEVKRPFPPKPIDEENKENIEKNEEKSQSYEDLKITVTPEKNAIAETNSKHIMSEEDIAQYAKEAIAELIKLIEEDYPRAQCLGWLELIKKKCRTIDNEPEYWECRAAIEQSAGNVRNAIEFYKAAIVQGAEVNSVDKSLDQLLTKFSLLNISPKNDENGGKSAKNERIVREARNVFKSSIIQFAVRERNIKKSKTSPEQETAKKLIATPVRRSTRLSRSMFTNTSGVQLCDSLREIDLSSKEISFEKNEALI